MNDKENLFKLLCKKEIYAILDGDTECGKYTLKNGDVIEIKMPYLRGLIYVIYVQHLDCQDNIIGVVALIAADGNTLRIY